MRKWFENHGLRVQEHSGVLGCSGSDVFRLCLVEARVALIAIPTGF